MSNGRLEVTLLVDEEMLALLVDEDVPHTIVILSNVYYNRLSAIVTACRNIYFLTTAYRLPPRRLITAYRLPQHFLITAYRRINFSLPLYRLPLATLITAYRCREKHTRRWKTVLRAERSTF